MTPEQARAQLTAHHDTADQFTPYSLGDRVAAARIAAVIPNGPSREAMTTGDCVVGIGHFAQNGYVQRGRIYLHREALALKLGRPVKRGMDACHTCDNRACINPEHLYEGTRKQNMADCTARGRHNKPRGEKHWMAKVTASQVREMRELTNQGWTRKALGEKYGINPATVSRIVRNIWRTEVA